MNLGTAPPVVEFRGVSKVFAPGTERAFKALEEITFAIEDLPGRGELIAILGPSGCGKSTLLNLIAGFPETGPPTSGEVLVRGKSVSGPGRDRGMIFQRYSSFPHLTALENVRFGLDLAPPSGLESVQARSEKARAWLGRVGLEAHVDKYPHQLSGGQQQRVALARSLVLHPKILLMDEPFSALDEPTRLDMQQMLLELWEEIEATVFLVTHSIAEAVYLADRIWIFTPAPGRIARELSSEIPSFRGLNPLEAHARLEFRTAVEEVSQIFRAVTGTSEPA